METDPMQIALFDAMLAKSSQTKRNHRPNSNFVNENNAVFQKPKPHHEKSVTKAKEVKK